MRPNLFAGFLSFALVVTPTIALAQTHAPDATPFSLTPHAAPAPDTLPASPQQQLLDARAKLALPPNAKYPQTEHPIEPGICMPGAGMMLNFLHDARGMVPAVQGNTVTGDGAVLMLYNPALEWVLVVGSVKGVCIIGDGVNLHPVTVAPQGGDQGGEQGDDSEPQAYHQPGCEKRMQGCPETEEQLGRRQQSSRSQAVF